MNPFQQLAKKHNPVMCLGDKVLRKAAGQDLVTVFREEGLAVVVVSLNNCRRQGRDPDQCERDGRAEAKRLFPGLDVLICRIGNHGS